MAWRIRAHPDAVPLPAWIRNRARKRHSGVTSNTTTASKIEICEIAMKHARPNCGVQMLNGSEPESWSLALYWRRFTYRNKSNASVKDSPALKTRITSP